MKAKHYTPIGTPVSMTALERLKYDLEEKYFDQAVDVSIEGAILTLVVDNTLKIEIERRGKRDWFVGSESFPDAVAVKQKIRQLVKDNL